MLFLFLSWDSSVSKVTRLRAELPEFYSRQGRWISLFQTDSGAHPASYLIGTGGRHFPRG